MIDNVLRVSTQVARWFDGEVAPELERLLVANRESLPGDLTVLERLERIVDKIKVLQSGRGTPSDALLIVRTLEAFDGRLVLPAEDCALLSQQLCQLGQGTLSDIRSASLTKLAVVDESLPKVAGAVSQWIRTNLRPSRTVSAVDPAAASRPSSRQMVAHCGTRWFGQCVRAPHHSVGRSSMAVVEH